MPLIDLPPPPPDPPVLQAALAEAGDKSALKSSVIKLRPKAIREAAYTYGLQLSVKWHWDRIGEWMESRSDDLDKIFAFGRIVRRLPGGVFLRPPVLTEAHGGVQIEGRGHAVTSAATYRIVRPAAFVASPPSWRDYVIRKFRVASVHPAVKPVNGEERKIWRSGIRDGWNAGRKQAFEMLEVSLSRLERDYLGMVVYEKLAEQGMVSMPRVADGSLQIRVGDKDLEVGRQVFRISRDASFSAPGSWRALPYEDRDVE